MAIFRAPQIVLMPGDTKLNNIYPVFRYWMIPPVNIHEVHEMAASKVEGLLIQKFNLQKQLIICDTEVLLNNLRPSNNTLESFAELPYFIDPINGWKKIKEIENKQWEKNSKNFLCSSFLMLQ